MMGNDIVDLALADKESNWKRKGYLSKLYTEGEQELILGAEVPSLMLWRLWSMKEAAYKIYNRLTGRRFFAPARFVCTPVARHPSSGIVTFGKSVYHTSSSMVNGYIHTIAQPAGPVKKPEAILIKSYPEKVPPGYKDNFLTNGYYLQKNKYGLPYVINSESRQPRNATVSHHGRFVAVVIG